MNEEEKLIPLTQCRLLVEHNFMRSCHNAEKIDANLIFGVEPKLLFLECASQKVINKEEKSSRTEVNSGSGDEKFTLEYNV